MATEPGAPALRDPVIPRDRRLRRKICDAVALLDFAIGSGFKDAAGRTVSQDLIATIQSIAAKFGPLDEASSEGERADRGELTVSDVVRFDQAYYQLSSLMRPITAETLRNTEGTSYGLDVTAAGDGVKTYLVAARDILFGFSPAQKFSRALWVGTILLAAFVIYSEWYLSITALDGDQAASRKCRVLLELLVPWAYGGLGSCVFLLKSAHIYMHERTFDLRRKPEYFNRIILGTIAGGAIMLFVNQIAADDGSVIRLSSAAMGFLAGYSTEFLYQTLERVINAILPKVGLDTVARQRSSGAASLGAVELTELLKAAQTPEERAAIMELIKRQAGVAPGEAPAPARRGSRRGGEGE